MAGYRCGNCKKELMGGSIFCPNCEVFFSLPVSHVPPTPGDVFVKAADMSTYRTVSKIRNLAVALGVACLVTLIFMFQADRSSMRDLESLLTRPPDVRASMLIDTEAERLGTIKAYTLAADQMVGVAGRCVVRHRPIAGSRDAVTLVVPGGIGPRKARSKAEFALLEYLSVRNRFMPRAEALAITVTVYDKMGRRMGMMDGEDVRVAQA